jgi:hypothetical protein
MDMERKFIYRTLLITLIFIGSIYLLFLTGCTDEDPNPPVQPETLLTYEEVLNRTQVEIEILVSLAGITEMAEYMLYDITVYSITYKTYYQDQEVIASGLVTFPNTNIELPIMSFQHGTIIKHSDAPTQDLTLYGLLSSVASTGYIFCVPDFLGFGSSSGIFHPYYHAETTGTTVIDMIKAANELSETLGYTCNGDVFLTGYSEGGYATMTAHKMMEESNITGYNLIASAPSSGGYDLKGMQEFFFSQETYHEPYYLAYVAMSYKHVYGFENILTDIFQAPYDSEIPGYFDGTLSGDQINAGLTNVMPDLLKPEILANIDTDSKYDYLNDALEVNSVDSWVPENRMFMYHGTADITVPYQNSLNTYNNMIQLGASPDVLSIVPLQDATHGTGIFPYIEHVIKTFDVLK